MRFRLVSVSRGEFLPIPVPVYIYCKPFLARARGVDILTSVTDGHVLMHVLRSYVSCDHVTLPIAAFFCACDLA